MSERSDILLKLFGTLKEAFERTEKSSENLVRQQGELVLHIKGLKLDEIKQELKDHGKESSDDIGTCTEEVKKVDNRVTKMIIVVITAATLFSLAALISTVIVYFGTQTLKKQVSQMSIVSQSEEEVHDSHESLKQEIRITQEEEHEKLRNELINTIREEFKKQKEEDIQSTQ